MSLAHERHIEFHDPRKPHFFLPTMDTHIQNCPLVVLRWEVKYLYYSSLVAYIKYIRSFVQLGEELAEGSPAYF